MNMTDCITLLTTDAVRRFCSYNMRKREIGTKECKKERSWLKALKSGLGWKTGKRMGVECNLDSMQSFAEETNTIKRVLRYGRVDEKQLRGWIDRLLYTAHCKDAFKCMLTSTRPSPRSPSWDWMPSVAPRQPCSPSSRSGLAQAQRGIQDAVVKRSETSDPPPVTTKIVNEDDFLSL